MIKDVVGVIKLGDRVGKCVGNSTGLARKFVGGTVGVSGEQNPR